MSTIPHPLQILSFIEAGRLIGKSPATISRWVKAKKIRTVSLGGRPGVLFADLARALEQPSFDSCETKQKSQHQ